MWNSHGWRKSDGKIRIGAIGDVMGACIQNFGNVSGKAFYLLMKLMCAF